MSQAEEGFALKYELEGHGYGKMGMINNGAFKATVDRIREWVMRTRGVLESIFPRPYEVSYFYCANILPLFSWNTQSDQKALEAWDQTIMTMLQNLEKISARLGGYTQLPLQSRVYVEDIDSFAKVRDINPDRVKDYMKGGRINLEEEKVQIAFEEILGETFHKKDHGGEINDLSTHVQFFGKRRAAGFLLKGRGTKSKELQIKDCGHDGGQLLRLFSTQVDLYVVQYVGHVSDAVVADVAGKAEQERGRGREVCFCVINGTDTARVLSAYRPELLSG